MHCNSARVCPVACTLYCVTVCACEGRQGSPPNLAASPITPLRQAQQAEGRLVRAQRVQGMTPGQCKGSQAQEAHL